jgi:hypothetical protein
LLAKLPRAAVVVGVEVNLYRRAAYRKAWCVCPELGRGGVNVALDARPSYS